MKKILSCIALFFVLSLFSNQAHANQDFLEKDYLKMMEIIKEAVINGYTDEEIVKLQEVTKFKADYTEEEINDFLVDNIYDKESEESRRQELEKVGGIELSEDDKEVIEFDDGTFMVLSNQLEYEDATLITPFATGTYNAGYGLINTNKKEFWGIYLAARAELKTFFTLHKDKVNITSVTRGNSTANFPTTLQVHSTKAVTNNAKSVKSQGSYTRVNGVVIGSQPIGSTHSFDLDTTIKITKVSGNRVTINRNNVYRGK